MLTLITVGLSLCPRAYQQQPENPTQAGRPYAPRTTAWAHPGQDEQHARVLISFWMRHRTFAHELGHAFGLPDEYADDDLYIGGRVRHTHPDGKPKDRIGVIPNDEGISATVSTPLIRTLWGDK